VFDADLFSEINLPEVLLFPKLANPPAKIFANISGHTSRMRRKMASLS
jgi:hypothetical protein